jgi:hypothetical protein
MEVASAANPQSGHRPYLDLEKVIYVCIFMYIYLYIYVYI